MTAIDFFQSIGATRDAGDRRGKMKNGNLPAASEDYLNFGADYFDNPDLGIGYGGYHYDGRYGDAASEICRHYNLQPGSRVLEIGCAKGFLLYEFHRLGLAVTGLDISDYAVGHAHPEVQRYLCLGDTSLLPFPDGQFDLVLAKEILPHVRSDQLHLALAECARVSRGGIYFVIQAGRGDGDLEEMAAWDPTHQVLRTEAWWRSALADMPVRPDVIFKHLF